MLEKKICKLPSPSARRNIRHSSTTHGTPDSCSSSTSLRNGSGNLRTRDRLSLLPKPTCSPNLARPSLYQPLCMLERSLLLKHRELNNPSAGGLIFPSVLLANRTLHLTVLPPSHLLPNIVLHFLGYGLTCREETRAVQTGEPLLRLWSLRTYSWRHTALSRGWSSKDASTQASVLQNLLKPSEGYHLDCASHVPTTPGRTVRHGIVSMAC